MDAGALLRAQGWRGKGFSLHPTNNTIGLSKPLLISRNTDGSGVGKKAHYTSDQWWLHAFDQKLKGLDTSKKGVVTQSVTQGKLDVIASSQPKGKYVGVSGLYSSFVRGGMLDGTVEDTTGDSTPATTPEDSEAGSVSRKEKRGESRAERQARKAGKRLRKAEKARRKVAERRAAVEKAVAKAAKKEMKRARKAGETKEERRARREERRARKESKRKQAGLAQKADQG
jgi:nucleolar protein TMA23